MHACASLLLCVASPPHACLHGSGSLIGSCRPTRTLLGASAAPGAHRRAYSPPPLSLSFDDNAADKSPASTRAVPGSSSDVVAVSCAVATLSRAEDDTGSARRKGAASVRGGGGAGDTSGVGRQGAGAGVVNTGGEGEAGLGKRVLVSACSDEARLQKDLERSAADKRRRLESAYYQAVVHPLVNLESQSCLVFMLSFCRGA